ncbi:MAG: hypothetical protein KKC26_07990 [Nanoarchaeota archaeon]|nr:hypothetical protein [Nanoarchaeota archaeon]
MKLEDMLKKDQLMYLERYVNDRKYADYATFSEVKNIYHPIEGKNSFMLG